MSNEIVRIERPDPPAEIWTSILKSAFSAVPVLGQALMEVVFDWRSRLKQARINRFFIETAEEIKKTSDKKIDYQYLKSDEFSDLIEDILTHVSRTRSEVKRQYLRNILINALTGKREPDLSRSFLSMLAEISDREVDLFGILFKRHRSSLKAPSDKWEDMRLLPNDAATIGFSPNEYLVLVQSLIRNGLLLDNTFRVIKPTAYTHLTITELGERFYDYIISDVAS